MTASGGGRERAGVQENMEREKVKLRKAFLELSHEQGGGRT